MTEARKNKQWGVLLVNLGTPEAPTISAVRRYLAEFLWDPRVVEIPRLLWWPILHGVILRVRSRKSAKAYQSIWTETGSPLLALTGGLMSAVERELKARFDGVSVVNFAMRYGTPSVAARLESLKSQGIGRFLIFPLYPQYSSPSTGSVFDAVAAAMSRWRRVPEVHFVSDYFDHPAYISAITESVERHWRKHGRGRHLLISFHGLPEKSRAMGDPYFDQCQASARLIAERLGLNDGAWQVGFQSRFGPAEWLQPYCIDVLKQLPQRGIREVDVVCPGFGVDCLETLEEIGITNKAAFMHAGGIEYHLISCLNDSPEHARALAEIILDRIPKAEYSSYRGADGEGVGRAKIPSPKAACGADVQ